MTEPSISRAGPVVVGYETAARSAGAAELGRELARALGRPVLLVHVAPTLTLGGRGSREYEQIVAAEGEAILERARSLFASGSDVRTSCVSSSAPALVLQDTAATEDASLLVVGSSRRGPLGYTLLGTTAERALHGADCAVAVSPVGWTVPDGGFGRLVVAYDGGEAADAALDAALELARGFGVPVALRAWPFGSVLPESWAREQLRRGAARVGDALLADAEIVPGADVAAIAEATGRTDLLVAGSRGRGAVGRVLLGTQSGRLVRHARCPTVVVPGP